MIRFLIRRILLTIPVLFGIVFVVFALARIVPADPCQTALGERATPALCNSFIQRYGLDKPIIPAIYKTSRGFDFRPDTLGTTLIDNQFVSYLAQLARLDLGDSIQFGRPVAGLIIERLPLTVELTILALLWSVTLGVILGLISAIKRNSAIDSGTMLLANVGVSIPIFVLGLIFQYVFAVLLRGTFVSLPPSGRAPAGVVLPSLSDSWGLAGLPGPLQGLLDFISNMYLVNSLATLQFDQFIDIFRHMILPAIALGTISLAITARMTRSSLLDVLGHDYIRTARAKGVGRRQVVLRHGMRNAMLPVITIVGLQLGGLLGGAVLTETIFNLTGVGRTLYDAIQARDYVVIQAFTLMIAVIYVVVNLIVDISYAYLDPRIRLS
jgi:ABC-type dipeptide/oligopeptide/nickel transport system permease component